MSDSAKARPRRRWRRVFAVILVVALALVVALFAIVAFTAADERFVARLISRRLGAEVTVGWLDWKLDGKVIARDVTARLPAGREDFFGVDTVDLELEFLPPRIAKVVLRKPRLVATEAPDGRIDLQDLVRGGSSDSPPPTFEIQDGELELRGDGPIGAKLRRLVAADTTPTIAISSLTLTPQDGVITISGFVVPARLTRVRIGGRVRDGRLESLSATISPADALDLPSLRALVSPQVASWLDINAVAGSIHGSGTVDFDAERPKYHATLELADVSFRLEVFPTTITGLRGRVRVGDREVAFDGLSGRHDGAAVTVSGKISDPWTAPRAKVTVRVDSATVDDELRAALSKLEVGKESLAAFAPEGRYSVTVTIATVPGQEHPDVRIELDVEEMAGVFHGYPDDEGVLRGLPMRVEGIRGRLDIAPHEVSFERVFGVTRGGARVEASARYRELDEIELRGDATAFDAPIDDELLAATDASTGPVVREIVTMLGLAGRIDASARFQKKKGAPLELALELEPRATVMRPQLFPYPVRLEGGKVRIDGERVVIDALRGTAGRGSVEISGEVLTLEDPPLSIRLSARGIALDEAFLATCASLGEERIDDGLRSLHPEGEIDLDLTWTREVQGGPLVVELRLAPQDVTLELHGGAAVARHVRGALTLTRHGEEEPWQLDLETDGGITGSFLGGTLHLLGRGDDAGEGTLRIAGSRLVVGPEMRAALAPFAPDVADFLEQGGWEGRVRVSCELARRDGEFVPTLVDVEPDSSGTVVQPGEFDADGVALAPPWIGLGVRWLGGTIRVDFDERRLEFDRVIGRVGAAHLSIEDGTILLEDDGISATLSAEIDSLSFQQWIELVFGSEQRREMLPLGPLGRTRIAARALRFHMPKGAKYLDRLSGEGELQFDGWTFYTGGGLDELTGTLEISRFEYVRDAEGRGGIAGVRADGRFSGVTLKLGPVRFSNLDCDLTLAEGRLSAPWIAADLSGGRLRRERNRFGITLLDEMPFDGRLELESGDVSRLLGDDAPRMRGLVGRVDAEIGFRGLLRTLLRGEGLPRLEAGGTVSISNAKLWSIPVFDKLYTGAILPLVGTSEGEAGESEPPKWTRGEIDFALQGTYLRLTKVELEGEPLVLRGDGTLGPDQLSLNFYPEVRTGVRYVRDLPILGWVVDFLFSIIERQVGSFRFQGPYASPEVVWDPVSLVPRPDLAIRLELPRTSTPPETPRPERF